MLCVSCLCDVSRCYLAFLFGVDVVVCCSLIVSGVAVGALMWSFVVVCCLSSVDRCRFVVCCCLLLVVCSLCFVV